MDGEKLVNIPFPLALHEEIKRRAVEEKRTFRNQVVVLLEELVAEKQSG